MTRDNEKIIRICSDLSATVKSSAMGLLDAGAPAELVCEVVNSARILENIPFSLGDRYHGEVAGPSPQGLEGLCDRLDKLIQVLESR